MKIFVFLLAISLALPTFARPMAQDTTHTPKENRVNELFMIGRKVTQGFDNGHTFSPFKGHLSGFGYGFINFAHTDYSMYAPETGKFMELDWTHSFALQFNLAKYSLSLVPGNNFGLVTGLGLEYQRMRFETNYLSIVSMDHKIEPVYLHDNPQMPEIKRSTFKVLYLTIPLLMEVQFPASHQQRFYASAGFIGGVRMHSKTKVVYKNPEGDKHKEKNKGHFNMVPFKVDVTARIGYQCVQVFGNYTLTHMFKSGKGPELNVYTVGLGITI